MKLNYFLFKVKDVKIKDLAATVPMMIGWALSPFLKKKYCNTWLIGENGKEARDNGYYFYRYMRNKHPEQPCVFFISKRSKEAKKVREIGPIVSNGSIKHWIMYFTCRWCISSQKGGKPNAALCSFIELNRWFYPHFVFLQHGVTKDLNGWLLSENCIFDYIITATKSEYEFMKSSFGYKDNVVQFTGFPRFDNLHDFVPKPGRVLIMPTWRMWLYNRSSKDATGEKKFSDSQFLKCWTEFLNSNRLQELAQKYSLELLFYPHRQIQEKISDFRISNPFVKIINSEDLDIQEALKSSKMLITDWSSVFFDMIYMKKPVVFYQFDEKDFRAHHYQKGWFDYHNNPYGASFHNADEVINAMEQIITSDYHVSKEYLVGHKKEFEFYDDNNSERIYELLSIV